MESTPIRRALKALNVPLTLAVLALLAFGVIMVSSATAAMTAHSAMVKRQIIGILVGLVPFGIAWGIDYQKLRHWVGPLAIVNALLIISPRIPGLGDTANGATSWLQIAGHRLFQPSEPAKIILIIVMATVVSQFKGRIESARDVAKVLAYLGIPLALILLQPDLGTGMVFVAITMGMLLVGGMKTKWFLIFGLCGVVLVGGVLQLHVLKKYQEDRLLVFVDPTRDPGGAGYNLTQSKIAIGSGGLTGKGLGSGTQSNLNFVPERHTDFIFSVLGEELGFLGSVLLLGLYLGLLVAALEVAASSRDLFGALIVAGVIAMWTFQILVNIGMTVGMMPITGIPLPFMSFGSSFMVTNFAAIGMLMSVWSRRYGV